MFFQKGGDGGGLLVTLNIFCDIFKNLNQFNIDVIRFLWGSVRFLWGLVCFDFLGDSSFFLVAGHWELVRIFFFFGSGTFGG